MFSEVPIIVPAPAPPPAPVPIKVDIALVKKKPKVVNAPASAWGRFSLACGDEALARIEADLTKAETQMKQEKQELMMEQRRNAARERAPQLWDQVREYSKDLGKTRWRRIIDRDALARLRLERDQRLELEQLAGEAIEAVMETILAEEIEKRTEAEHLRQA